MTLKRLLYFFGSLMFLGLGISHLWNAYRHPAPVSVALNDSNASSLPWNVHLTDIVYAPLETVSIKRISETMSYIPVRGKNTDPKAEFKVVVMSRDPALLKGAKPEDTLRAVAQLFQKTEVTGAVDDTVTDSVLRKIHETNPRIARNPVVINDGEKPPKLFGWFASVVGLGLFLRAFGGSRPATAPSEPPVLAPPPAN